MLGGVAGETGMKIDAATIISLVLAIVFMVGGLWLVPLIAGSEQTPWPQLGAGLGWVAYRIGWGWWQGRAAPPR